MKPNAFPPSPQEHTKRHAVDMVTKLELSLSYSHWTHSQRASLTRMLRRWQRRAKGQDVRWLVVGDKHGRLTIEEQARIEAMKAGAA